MQYWCGIREGELLALTPEDFDFKNTTVSINKSYQRLHGEDYITSPKTKKSVRTIKMPKFLREQLMRKFGTAIDDQVIEEVLRNGTADIGEKYLKVIQKTARQYVAGIMRRLREHEYNPELMKLYIVICKMLVGGLRPKPWRPVQALWLLCKETIVVRRYAE